MALGICCVCQEKVSIVASALPRMEANDHGSENWEIDMEYGESIDFICESHDFYGQHCDGSGQIPQVVLT